MNYTDYQDATALAQAIKKGEITAVEAVKSAILQIRTQNDRVNAVTYLREEAALHEAENLINLEAPFAGVPILIKDLGHDLKGQPSTSGSKLFKDNVAIRTTNFTQSLIDAGFIIVGQTHVPEMGFVTYSYSELFGTAKNNINPDYTPGGSSGGAAAAIQTGMVPIASASDGGGSIRVPASYSGLIGLKPTRGRTPVGPGKWRSWAGAAVGFALTKSVRDAVSLLMEMQSTDMANPFLVQPLTESEIDAARSRVKKLRIAYSTDSPVAGPVSDEAVKAVEKAVAFLRAEGFTVEAAKPDIDGLALMKQYYRINSTETASTFEMVEKNLGRPITPDDVELQSWVVGQYGKRISGTQYTQALHSWDLAAEAMMDFHQKYDIYIQPTTASHAPRNDKEYHSPALIVKMKQAEQLNDADLAELYWEMFLETLKDAPFCQQANMTGSPAISLPLHTCENGLPLGVQFTAPKGREDWLLALAELFEKAGEFENYK